MAGQRHRRWMNELLFGLEDEFSVLELRRVDTTTLEGAIAELTGESSPHTHPPTRASRTRCCDRRRPSRFWRQARGGQQVGQPLPRTVHRDGVPEETCITLGSR